MKEVDSVPHSLTAASALKIVRRIAMDSNNIVVVRHAAKRAKQRMFTRTQIERCVRKGTISEGPFLNVRGNWQVNLSGHAAGEKITCVVAIEWAARLLVITVF
jgi:putative transcriptional regulator